MSAREDIADAANTVDGLNVTPAFRQVTKPGEGFVSWNGSDRDDSGFGFIDRWSVWIAASQDRVTAELWIEENLPAILDALRPELVVTTANPTEMILGTGSINGLVIEGNR